MTDFANHYIPSPVETQAKARRQWHERGFGHAQAGREALSEARLRELGGELALRAYRRGYRLGRAG